MQSAKGFTLIELMITVAIVAILAAVAVPAYQEQVRRGKRSDGHAYLLALASLQERFYTQNVSYANSITAANGLNQPDVNSPEDFYTATLAVTPAGCGPGAANCTTYTLTVTPVAADTKCATLTYTHLGVKGSTGTAATPSECWR